MKASRCEKTTKLCDKREYKEASMKEIILINLHVWHCKSCKEYSRKTTHFSKKLMDCSFKKLSPDQKYLLKQQLDEALKKHPDQLD